MLDARILTVRQPWASAIVTGAKTVEHRSWPTSYRGRLWVHAGLTADADGHHLPRGVVLGHVELVGCEPGAEGWEWALARPVALREPVAHRGVLGLRRVDPELAVLLGS